MYIYVCIYARGLQMSRKKTLLLTKRANRVIIFKIREDLHLKCNSENVSCNSKNSILKFLLLGFAHVLMITAVVRAILSFKFHFMLIIC